MHKAIISAAALILAVTLVLFVGPWGNPRLENAGDSMALADDGITYLCENRDGSSYIYGVNRNGNVDFVYRENNRSGSLSSAIRCLTVSGRTVWFLRECYEDGAFYGWELGSLSTEGGKSRNHLSFEDDPTLPERPISLSVYGDEVFLAEKSASSVRGWSVDLAKDEPEAVLREELEVPAGAIPVSAAFGRYGLYVLLDSGEVRCASAIEAEGESVLADCGCIAAGERSLACFDRSLMSELLIAGAFKSEAIFLGEDLGISVRACEGGSDGTGALLAVDSDGNACLIMNNGADLVATKKLGVSVLAGTRFRGELIWKGFLCTLILCAAALGLWTFFRRCRKTAVKLAVACALSALIAAALCVFFSLRGFTRAFDNQTLALLEQNAAAVEARLDESALAQIGSAAFYGSEDRLSLLTALQGGALADNELYTVDEEPILSVSETRRWGLSAAEARLAREAALIEQTLDSGNTASTVIGSGPDRMMVLATPLRLGNSPAAILVSRLEMRSISTDRARLAGRLAGSAVLGAVVALLLGLLLVRRMGENSTGKQTKTVAGREDKSPSGSGRKEQGETGALRRFLPESSAALLGHRRLSDVKPNDYAVFTCTTALFGVTDIAERRDAQDPGGYMKFLSGAYDRLSETVHECGGTVVSSDLDPEAVLAAFTGVQDRALECATILTADNAEVCIFALLHRHEVLFGAAGSPKRTVPVVESAQLRMLRRMMPSLQDMGLRLVYTKACRESRSMEVLDRCICLHQDEACFLIDRRLRSLSPTEP